MSYKRISLLIVFAASLILPSVWGQGMGHVILPDADLMIQIKLASIRNSPIFTAMKKLKEEQQAKAQEGQLAGIEETDEVFKDLQEITGLESTDLLLLVATVNLDGVNWDEKPEMSGLNALAALKLGKELSVDKLETGLKSFAAKKAAEEEEKPLLTVSRSSYGDNAILQLKEADDEDPIYLTMTSGDKVLLIGTKSAVEGALDRYASGSNVAPTSLFPASVGKAVGRSGFYILLKPTADMLAKMSKQEEGAPNPAKALLTQLKAFGLGINFGEAFDLALVSDFATPEAAQQASMLTDAQAISGIKMFASMMTGGAQLPMLQTMKTGAGKTGMAWFKMSLSKADLDVIAKVAEQKMQAVPVTEETMQWEEE